MDGTGMNKKFAATIVTALAAVVPAKAADVFIPEAPVLTSETSIYDWSGFYIGIGGGTGYVLDEISSPVLGSTISGWGGQGYFGKVQVGYDHMFSNGFVVGAQLVGRYGDINTSASIPLVAVSTEIKGDYGFDAIARLGYAVTPRTLAYVMGGYSWQNFELSSTLPGLSSEWSDSGYVVGFGLETAFRNGWTWGGSYRFSKYSGTNIGPLGGIEVNPAVHSFHSSINYRFGGGPSDVTREPVNYDWTGLKIGGAISGGVALNKVNGALGLFSIDSLATEGFLGEVTLSYDREFGANSRWVFGAQLAAQFIEASSSSTVAGVTLRAEAENFGFDALLRGGYKLNDYTLGYVIGGYTWQEVTASLSFPALAVTEGLNGFTIGTGTELALNERLTGFIEYRYTMYEDFDLGVVANVESSSHTVRVGAKWKLF